MVLHFKVSFLTYLKVSVQANRALAVAFAVETTNRSPRGSSEPLSTEPGRPGPITTFSVRPLSLPVAVATVTHQARQRAGGNQCEEKRYGSGDSHKHGGGWCSYTFGGNGFGLLRHAVSSCVLAFFA